MTSTIGFPFPPFSVRTDRVLSVNGLCYRCWMVCEEAGWKEPLIAKTMRTIDQMVRETAAQIAHPDILSCPRNIMADHAPHPFYRSRATRRE